MAGSQLPGKVRMSSGNAPIDEAAGAIKVQIQNAGSRYKA
jgi:hypothetical protein